MALTAGVNQAVSDSLGTFLTEVGQDAIAVAEDLASLVMSAVSELLTVITDPNQARGAGLATLLTNLENLLVDLVALGKAAADAFFTMLNDVVEAVQAALNATIDIPIVSDLYQWLTGDSLTILDLFSLIVAIPTTVIYKVITGSAPYSSEGAKLVGVTLLNVEAMIYTFNGLIYMFVDAVSNLMGNNSPAFLNYVEAVLIGIDQAIGIPLGYSGNQARDYTLLWIYGWLPAVWAVNCGMEQSAGNTVSNVVLPFHGIGTAIWEGVYAIMYPSDFFDDGIKLVQNELGAFSTIAGFAKLSDSEEALAILAAACFFLDLGNALIEMKYWGLGSSSIASA
jgi:hypothetical protein